MVRSERDLERLAEEFAELSAEERARVLAEASRRAHFKLPPAGFSPPVLTGGTHWIGGSLHREDLYGDDGR